MSRHGKIARLPRMIRDELNNRLMDGEPGGHLLKWLNELPEIKKVMARHFKGLTISKQNLSQWRNGGFAEWRVRQEYRGNADELAADAREIGAGTGGRLGDHLATVLEARYASVLTGWNGEVSEALDKKLKVLHGLCRDVALLRRGDHSGARLQLDQDQVELLRKRTEAEVLEHFQAWMENEKIRDWLCAHWPSPEERKRQLYAMYGMTVPGEAGSAKDQAPSTGEGSSTHEPGGAMGETANSQVQNPEKVQSPTSNFGQAGSGVVNEGAMNGDLKAQIAELNRQAAVDGQRGDSLMKSGLVKPSQTDLGAVKAVGEQGRDATDGNNGMAGTQEESGLVKVNQTDENGSAQDQAPSSREGASPNIQGGAMAGKAGGEVPKEGGLAKRSLVEPAEGPITAISYQVPKQNYQSPLAHPVLARLKAEREAKAAKHASVTTPVLAPVVGCQKKLGPVGGVVPLDQIPGSYGSFRSSS